MSNHPHGAGRRQFLHTAALGLGGIAAAGAAGELPAEVPAVWREARARAAFKHSVCRWCYSGMTVDALARAAQGLGMQSVELLEPDEWAVARAHGLTCAMGYAPAGDPKQRLTHGWNHVEHHAWLVPGYLEGIRLAAAAGVPNVICFSGSRMGLNDQQGLENCARGLRQILPAAEKAGVTICMELLNSKVDHADYQADRTPWGAALVDKIGSPRFRLLYDIYHMQIMEGDVIRTVRTHKDHIAHFHTAGVPGRHEIDATQELNYPAIARAIADLGFTGFVAQEFIPTRDPLTSLAEAVRLCRV